MKTHPETVLVTQRSGQNYLSKIDKSCDQSEAKLLADVAELPLLLFEVPKSTYGTAVMMPLLVKPVSCADWLATSGVHIFWHVLTCFVQAVLIRSIKVIYDDELSYIESGDCDQLDGLLYFLCLWLWTFYVLGDIQETADMTELFLRQIPTITSGIQPLTFLKEKNEDISWSGKGGLSMLWKVGFAVFLLLPKLGIAAVLLAFGAMYLSISTSNSGLILNTLALCFIIDTDELVYHFFVGARIQRLIDAVPAIELAHMPQPWRCWAYVAPVMKLLVSVSIAVVVMMAQPRCGYPSGPLSHGFAPPQNTASVRAQMLGQPSPSR